MSKTEATYEMGKERDNALADAIVETTQMLMARIAELEAENAALKTDAELGALVRRMPIDAELLRTGDCCWFINMSPRTYIVCGGTPEEALSLFERANDSA
jgi:hypothetical protein